MKRMFTIGGTLSFLVGCATTPPPSPLELATGECSSVFEPKTQAWNDCVLQRASQIEESRRQMALAEQQMWQMRQMQASKNMADIYRAIILRNTSPYPLWFR